MAATVTRDASDFRGVHGAQIAGAARRLPPGVEVDRASRLPRSRYPFLN